MTGQFPKGTAAPPNYPIQPGAAPGVNYGTTEPQDGLDAPQATETPETPKAPARRRRGTNADAVANGRVAGAPNDADAALPGEGKTAKRATKARKAIKKSGR